MSMVNESLTANDLMVEAPDTVNFYFECAIERIDNRLGEGYAKEHPELLAGFIQACATELHTAIEARETTEVAEAIQGIAAGLFEIREIMERANDKQ
jgi:hypothetical protein